MGSIVESLGEPTVPGTLTSTSGVVMSVSSSSLPHAAGSTSRPKVEIAMRDRRIMFECSFRCSFTRRRAVVPAPDRGRNLVSRRLLDARDRGSPDRRRDSCFDRSFLGYTTPEVRPTASGCSETSRRFLHPARRKGAALPPGAPGSGSPVVRTGTAMPMSITSRTTHSDPRSDPRSDARSDAHLGDARLGVAS